MRSKQTLLVALRNMPMPMAKGAIDTSAIAPIVPEDLEPVEGHRVQLRRKGGLTTLTVGKGEKVPHDYTTVLQKGQDPRTEALRIVKACAKGETHGYGVYHRDDVSYDERGGVRLL